MADYRKSVDSYFSNIGDLSNLNPGITNSSKELSTLRLNTVKIGYSTYIIAFIIIIVFFVIFSILNLSFLKTVGKENGNTSTIFTKLIEVIVAAFALVAVGMVSINYVLGLDVSASIKNLFSKDPNIDIKVTKVKEKTPKMYVERKEVFNIPKNVYSYEDAKLLCKAYDSELASINEVKNAYDNGGEWCSYGWSKNQMALFPTQHSTWKKLQKIQGHKNDCGRPGINGGYIDNPDIKFGVNCYGYKPKINKINRDYMDNLQLYPRVQKDKEMNERILELKKRKNNIVIAPFNNKKWNY